MKSPAAPEPKVFLTDARAQRVWAYGYLVRSTAIALAILITALGVRAC